MFRDAHGVPHIHAWPVMEQVLDPTTALDAAISWRASGSMMLVLAGDVGTGKSLAAAWALHDWLVQTTPRNPWGQRIPSEVRLWIAAPHFARLAPWGDHVVELERVGMLVVDDLGEEEASPKALGMVSALITTRQSNGLPTIITTNLDGETFQERYGQRLIDRLRQSGLREGADGKQRAKWWIRCTGESMRGKTTPRPRPPVDVEPPVLEDEGPLYGIGDLAAELGRLKAVNDGDHNRRAEPGEQGE